MALGNIVGNMFRDIAPELNTSIRKSLGGVATDSIDEGQLSRLADPELIVGRKGLTSAAMSGKMSDEQLDIMDENFKIAKKMFDRGETADDIIAKTGYFFDENGNVKTEIDDSQAKTLLQPGEMDTKKDYVMKDVFSHPTFFQYYPQYENMKVKFYKGKQDEGGYFDPNTDTIHINKNSPGFIDGDEDKVIATILHETQHAIQKLEKFTFGGDYKKFLEVPEEKATPEQLDKAYQKYFSIGGEAESRNVELRFLKPSVALRTNFLQTFLTDLISQKRGITRAQLTTPKGQSIDMRSVEDPTYRDPFEDTTQGL